MRRRLKLVVAYDGAPFSGWQSQRSGNTVQDYLEGAFASIAGEAVRVHGAGRTDAGVHALGQCAHVDLPDRSLRPEQWVAALNSALPATVRVLRCKYVSAAFHARYSAKGKTYRYRIWNDLILPPLEVGRAWHVSVPLHFEVMKAEAQAFVGCHDFSSFAANRGTPDTNTVRTIEAVRLRRSGRCIDVEVTGNGFLYKMVRLMIGALVRAGRNQELAGSARVRLAEPSATRPGAREVAPAAGLFLQRVRY